MDNFFKELRRRNVVRVAGSIAGIVTLDLVIVMNDTGKTSADSQ